MLTLLNLLFTFRAHAIVFKLVQFRIYFSLSFGRRRTERNRKIQEMQIKILKSLFFFSVRVALKQCERIRKNIYFFRPGVEIWQVFFLCVGTEKEHTILGLE